MGRRLKKSYLRSCRRVLPVRLIPQAVTTTLAVLHFVGRPFRHKMWLCSDRHSIVTAALGNAVLGVAGRVLWLRAIPVATH